jgi:hypothetical protein
MSPTASTTAGQAGDDDVEETGNSSDDGYYNPVSIMFFQEGNSHRDGFGSRAVKR